ncbi:subtilisin-like serine germination related protease [Clostridioides difficile]|nr:subtilisin-like serine germination related protease [Clostridioides difficile]
MATPHVTGVCSLFMEWGIVNGNDLFLYSQKLRALLLKGARRLSNQSYPNNSSGFGFLNLSDIDLYTLSSINQDLETEDIGYRSINKSFKDEENRYKFIDGYNIQIHNDLENEIYISKNASRQSGILSGIDVVHTPEFEEELAGLGMSQNFFKISDSLGVLSINNTDYSSIQRVLQLPSIIRTVSTTKMTLLGEINRGTFGGVVATEEMGVNFFKNNPNINITGRGTLISIADTGIDYLHPDFIYPDGTSKIVYLWDQTKEGTPPDGFYIGTEYTREDINRAIAENDPSLSQDEVGQGTMLSGICSGLGNVNSEYAGIAEDSELIIIKLGKIDGFYNSAMLFAASQYAYKKAFELRRPLVINMSLGTSSLAGLTNRSNSEKAFFTRGLCITAGAGNEGNTQTHTSGIIPHVGGSVEVELELNEDEEELSLELWLNRPDKADVIIVSPTGEESKSVGISNYNKVTGLFDLEGTEYSITPDFIYPDGTSKIVYLWDQTKEGTPPDGFYIGTEYTREDINRAIAENDPSLSQDEVGQGTMLSGICSGLGNVNSEYAGIAEDSELIIIKLGKIDDFYNSAMLFAASQYAYKKAFELGRPLVINMSLGTSSLAGLTNRSNSEKAFFTRGLCITAGAGNEGNTQTHTSGIIPHVGGSVEVELELNEDEEELSLELWLNRPDKADVIIVSPTGEESKSVGISNYNKVTGLFDLEGTEYSITYIYPTTFSGQQFTNVTLKNAKRGVWKIRLVGVYIITGRYNLYLPNRELLKSGTRFREVDPFYTINYPAIQDDLITVGAYNTINGSLWQSSSRGPTIEDRLKPDIVAPGVNIIAAYPGNTYATITGTAAASAHAAGAAAMYFQYTFVDGRYPNQAYVQKIKTFMQAGARKDSNTVYPNTNSGYGLLDVRGMFDVLR